MRCISGMNQTERMNARQREIFAELSSGIELKRWESAKKRIPDTPSHSTKPRTRKKQKTKNRTADTTAGVDLFSKGDAEEKTEVGDEEKKESRSVELERAATIRKEHGIKVSAPNTTPFPLQSFTELEEGASELKGIVEFAKGNGFLTLTPIQMQAIPALRDERDVVGIAPTGSGKTLAFIVPMLTQMRKRSAFDGTKALVVSPTCELSAQTYHTFVRLQKSLSTDWKPLSAFLLDKSSKKKLSHKRPDVLFAAPFALVKQIQKGTVDASQVQFLVLDEADRLFSMEKGGASGNDMSNQRHYVAQVDAIIAACSDEQLVKAMFSATFPPHVSDLADNILNDPVCITVGKKNAATDSVRQHLMYTGSESGKLLAVRQIFAKGISPPVVIFVDTKGRANDLLSELRSEGISVAGVHSEMEGRQRNRVLELFQNGHIWVLVATDLVSRGIDFAGVNMVINYDFPKSTTDYIHRIGRTGRAGKTGESYTFFTDTDRGYIRPIANTIREAGGDVPDWMTTLKKENWKYKKSYGAIGQDKDVL